MIEFDINKLVVEHFYLKSCTTAQGGSISVVDEAKSTEEREVYKTFPAPFAVVRSFIKRSDGVGKFFRPVLTAVTFYDGVIVSIERHALGAMAEKEYEGLNGTVKWKSKSEFDIERQVKNLTGDGREWLTDGSFIYTLNGGEKVPLSANRKFWCVEASSIKMADIGVNDIRIDHRTCLRYVAANGRSVTTSPIWKKLESVGSRQIARTDNEGEESLQFDRIDEHLYVNLGFILKAGTDISKMYGYDAIEPLQLDKLMVQLGTVNLPSIPKEIKQTFDVGTPFTHMVAWTIGLLSQTKTLDEYMTIRSLLKMLTTKGVYHRSAFDSESVFKNGQDESTVPMKTLEEAANVDFTKIDLKLVGLMTNSRRNREVNGVGVLYDAD
jgi:hypothetical protein